MSKRAMKIAIAAEQNGVDFAGKGLADDPALNDTDRRVPKAEGGTYVDRENVRVAHPLTHMKRHGILRERSPELAELKSVFDDRVQMMKLKLKINNQKLAYQRRVDDVHPETKAFLTAQLKPIEARLAEIDKVLSKLIKKYPDKLVQTALKVRGLGPVTVSALTVYVDMEKASTPSALWQYVGLDRPAYQRYEKNPEQQARRDSRDPSYYGSLDKPPTGWGGNKTLRTVLYTTAEAMMKDKQSPYRLVYDRVKARLAVSEKIVVTNTTAGGKAKVAWKDTKPSHRNGAALRAIMKHVLADYWFVGRTLAGLSTTPLYAQAVLGHDSIVSPRERGWEF